MKQALKMVDEINRKKAAVSLTYSDHVKRDYNKAIRSDIKELKEYCGYKGINFKEIKKRIAK